MKTKIFTIIVLVLFLATACGEDKAQTTAKPITLGTSNDSPTYEVDTTTNETTVINETEENETEEPEAIVATQNDFEIEEQEIVEEKPAESMVHGINITNEETFYGNHKNITKRDNTSIFVITDFDISTAAEDAGYRANVAKDDKISFTVTNRDDTEYYITYMQPKDSDVMHAMKIALNGHRIKDIDQKCGSKFIKPGETLTCTNVPAVLKIGLDIRFIPYMNMMSAETNYMESKLIFKIIEEKPDAE